MAIKRNPALRDDYSDNSFLLEKTEESKKDFKALNIRPEDRNNRDFESSGLVYTTEIVSDLLQRIHDGDQDVDMSPFYQGDPDLRGPNVSFQMTPEEEEEWTKCFLDPVYFVSKYCKFKTDKGWSTVDLYDFQEEIIRTTATTVYDEDLDLFVPKNRNVILCCSRQIGKTTTTVCILTYYLCFQHDKNVAVMANKLATSKEIVDKLINVFKGLPYFLKPGCINFGATYIKLDNGCRVIANSTTKSTSIGFTIDVLYLDEFAHVPPNVGYDFWRSVIPTLSSLKSSQCIISSTPNGVSNKFFEVWDGAMKNENSYVPIKVEWWRVPGRDEKWATQMKRDFGEEAFAQEFDLQFHVNSLNLVKSTDLKFARRISKEYYSLDFIGLDKSLSDKLYWSPNFDPTFITPNDYFVLSVDTAEGRDVETQDKKDSDYNIVDIFKIVPLSNASINRRHSMTTQYADCFRLQQVGIYMDRDVNEEGAATVAKFITFELFKCGVGSYDNVRVLIEMNFNGRNFINTFSKHNNYYPAIIFSTYHTKQIPGEKQRTKLGYKTTPGNREYFLKNGANLLSTRNIVVDQVNKNPNLSTINQLENFCKINGKYQGVSIHDDISMTVLNLSRLWDIEQYNNFLEDLIDFHLDPSEKRRIEYQLSKNKTYYDSSEDALNSMINVLGSEVNSYQGFGYPDFNSPYNTVQGALSNGGYPSYPGTGSPNW